MIGATGNQGSSVAHTFLGLSTWHVRCVTRNPSSSASQALLAKGAEIVQGDMSDQSTLVRAFENANSIFLNTDFWATYLETNKSTDSETGASVTSGQAAYDQEVSHGINTAIVAAGIESLERLIYSALGPMKKHSRGRFSHSYHWESKASIVEYIKNEQPELAKKTSFIYPGAFTTNPMMTPRLDPTSGKYTFVLPASAKMRMPIIDPRMSTGPFVRALVETEDAGTTLLAYDSYLTMEELVQVWSRVIGQEVNFVSMTTQAMHELIGLPLEALEAPGFIEEFGYMGGVENAIEPHQLKSKVQTPSFEEWLTKSDWKAMLTAAQVELEDYMEG